MNKYAATLLFLVFSNLAHSKEFKYSQVIGCGPIKPEEFSFQEKINDYKYYYIHKAGNGDFVIWNDNHQFASFEKIKYYQLFVQNGGETSASLRKIEGIERYSLMVKNKDSTWIKILMFDPLSMTYVSRVENYQPSMGVCWIENIK